MKMINKVYICSDFLSTKEKEQFNNLKWMFDLIKKPIELATNISPFLFSSSLTNENKLSRVKFFDLSGIELNIHETQYEYDSNEVNDESINYLSNFLDKNTLVIGYELSKSTKAILEKMNVFYIDIWLHPIRYLDDILFAFNSNHESIKINLAKYNINEELYYSYASNIKISKYKGYKRKNIKIRPNSALFIGQTLSDKAISSKNGMLNILDFKEQIDFLSKKYNKIYYSRHPFVKSGDEEILKYLKSKDIEITNESAYDLLSNDNIKYVTSVSSSVVHEAKYFDKETGFLFKPIFNLSKELGEDNYVSVFQSFCFGYFWCDILNPIINTNILQPVDFIEKKDKLRDSLAFYWSYKHVDKLEMIRSQLNAVDNKMQSLEKNKLNLNTKEKNVFKIKKMVKKYNPKVFLNKSSLVLDKNKIEKSLNKYDIVSFDIFDTLLERPFSNPNRVFELMNDFVFDITDGVIEDFKKIRLEARGYVLEENRTGEEVNLLERYEAICKKIGLSEEIAKKLYNKELELEEGILRPREDGRLLYEKAKKDNKRIFIISDIFYPKEFVESVLFKNGYTDFEKLYVSSEIGLLKHTGNLFKYVRDELNLDVSKWIHIGDNFHADVKMANINNIKAIHLKQTHEIYKFNNYLKFNNSNSSITEDVVHGLSASRFYSCFDSIEQGYFQGDPKQFGFMVVGPIISSFSQFIKSEVENNKFEKILFLARDGDIVKKAYDKLYPDDNTEYLLASRRSYSVASIYEKEDIFSLLDINFSPISLYNLLERRWGVTLDKKDLISEFKSINDIVRFKEDKEKIKLQLELISEKIIANSKKERDDLILYFDRLNLNDKNKKTIVDIGHHGTLQKHLSRILNENISGLYFSTFDKINDLDGLGLLNKGCLVDKLPSSKRHFYKDYILMFEFLFLNEDYSFVKFDKENPIYQSEVLEKNRINFTKLVHQGALDFVTQFKPLCDKVDLSINDVSQLYVNFLKNPSLIDTRMFSGIEFENMYSGREVRHIVSPLNSSYNKNSVWKEGETKLFISTPRIYRNRNVFVNYLAPLSYDSLKYFYKKGRKIWS